MEPARPFQDWWQIKSDTIDGYPRQMSVDADPRKTRADEILEETAKQFDTTVEAILAPPSSGRSHSQARRFAAIRYYNRFGRWRTLKTFSLAEETLRMWVNGEVKKFNPHRV